MIGWALFVLSMLATFTLVAIGEPLLVALERHRLRRAHRAVLVGRRARTWRRYS